MEHAAPRIVTSLQILYVLRLLSLDALSIEARLIQPSATCASQALEGYALVGIFFKTKAVAVDFNFARTAHADHPRRPD